MATSLQLLPPKVVIFVSGGMMKVPLGYLFQLSNTVNLCFLPNMPVTWQFTMNWSFSCGFLTYWKKNPVLNKVQAVYHKNNLKFGITVPKSIENVLALDKADHNHSWEDSINKEMTNVKIRLQSFGQELPSICRSYWYPLPHNFWRKNGFDTQSSIFF